MGDRQISADIIIVGGGLAGTIAATVLANQGHRVILVDPRPRFPQLFKAEKIDHSQVKLLRKLGLLQPIVSQAGRIHQVRMGHNGRVFKITPIEQYGISYADMVNVLRSHLPESVEFCLGSVKEISHSDEMQCVKLAGGSELTSRLAVIAGGSWPGLKEVIRQRRRVIQKNQSLVFGFDVERPDSQDFDFDSVTYYSLDPAARIGYLTLFRFRHSMRANLFVYRAVTDPWVRQFIEHPQKMLKCFLPNLDKVTGEFRIVTTIQSGVLDLFGTEGVPEPGTVLIGDAFQTACPSTGLGLSKILTDVDTLAKYVPRWMSTPGMSRDKVAEYYSHPQKTFMDSLALRRSARARSLATDKSLKWRLLRALIGLRWRVIGYSNGLREPKPRVRESVRQNPPFVLHANRIVETAAGTTCWPSGDRKNLKDQG